MKRHAYNPAPVLRALMIRRANKLIGSCPACRITRPLSPITGKCWPCDNLVSGTYPNAATDPEKLAHGELCNDCAFRPQSPESLPGSVDPEAVMHLAMPGCSERWPESTRDLIIRQAKQASAIFWCHKPFLEKQQEWGYDAKAQELTPLEGNHWRPCGGWCKVFDKAHSS